MEVLIMLFGQTQKMNKHQTTRTNSKKSFAPACLGLASIFLAAIFMSGCVVHHKGHGYKHGHGHSKGHGKGHHKGKIKIVPKAEISISPLIVIDD
jgi:hypothetical protein